MIALIEQIVIWSILAFAGYLVTRASVEVFRDVKSRRTAKKAAQNLKGTQG